MCSMAQEWQRGRFILTGRMASLACNINQICHGEEMRYLEPTDVEILGNLTKTLNNMNQRIKELNNPFKK